MGYHHGMGATTYFMRGFWDGAVTAATCLAVLAISFAAVFFVLLCGAPKMRLKR